MKMIPNPALTACLAVRRCLTALIAAVTVSTAPADYFVDFEGETETKASYASGTVKLSGLDWNMTETLIGTLPNDFKNGTKSARLRGYGTSSMAMLEDKTTGLGTLSFAYRSYGTETQVTWIVQYSATNGASWIQVGSPFTATGTAATFSETVNVVGPVRIRIIPLTTTGTSNFRMNIDDILLTDFGDPVVEEEPPVIVSTSPADNAPDVAIGTTLTITFDETVVAASGNLKLFETGIPTPVTLPTSSAVITGSTATFTLPAPLEYSTDYHVLLDAASFEDAAGNALATGITDANFWNFTTADEPAPTPPVVVRLSPPNDSTGLPAGDQFLEIEYDVDVVRGTGFLRVFDINDTSFPPTPIASFDVSDTGQVAIENNIVGFVLPVPVEAGKSYFVSGPAGLFLSVASNISSNAFGFDVDEIPWAFEIAVPDTTPPVLVATTPQNGPGAAASPTLTAFFDEPVSLSDGAWTVTVFDVTADQPLAEFSELNAVGISTGGSQLAISLPAPLAFNNTYRVILSAGLLVDAAGNPSAAVTGSAWEFTTGGPFVPGQIVISQVYGGGGNAGATLRNDFIELHNTSDAPISLSGWSVQYAASTRTSWQVTPLTGTIQPGGYFLIQQAAGTGGTEDLPAPDVIGTIAMAAGSAKVALVNSVTPLTGSSPVADPSVSDFVGYGAADAFEGSGAAPLLSATLAAIREVAGSQDSDNNAADFVAGTPAPRNSSSPPYFPGADGSGTAIASNATSGAGNLVATPVFPSMTPSQEVKVDLTGSFPGATISLIEIDVPSDFGVPLTENISLSGTGLGGGSATASGQTVSITGASLTETTNLSVVISGLAAPDVSADPADNGNRTFAVRTASDGGTLTAIISSPSVRVAMPVVDLATLRAVTLPSPKVYLIPNEVIVTYVEENSFRNQHYIQDATAGILIDDPSVTLGASYLRGDGLENLVGGLSVFQGLLQFNPIAATAAVSSTGNAPAPIPLTLAELAASPETYQSRLVRVNGVAFQDATGNFTNISVHVLTQDADTFAFRTFFDAEHSGTAIPTGNLGLIGIVRTLTDTSAALSPRSLADFTTGDPEPEPGYLDWAALYAGGGAFDGDFNADGVANGLAYFFGAETAGFVPTPGIEDGSITFPRDPSLTDVSFVVQTSDDLADWDDVLTEDLDLSDPNAITYVLPTTPGPFFVRIKVTENPAVD